MSQSAALDLNLHPKQGEALNTDATEVLYGGAAGGGKSHLMRVAAIIWCSMIPGLQVYLFRRIRDDLIKNHMEGPKGFRAILAAWNLAGLVTIVEDEIRFWNGSKIYLCHCKDEKDIYKYQGAEIHVLIIDELTHFTERMYRFLRNRVRMVGVKLPIQWRGRFPRILCGANPGNVGHQFVKTTFVDAAAPMACVLQPKGEGGMLRQFIPARLEDNPSMAEDDPGYENRLEGLGSAELVKAMRWGDWNVVEGAFFDKWSNRNIVKPFTVPQLWTRFRSFDWGYAKPFSVGWWAVASDPFSCGHVTIPRGALVRYREWYGCTGKPNEGVRLEAEQIAAGIKEREKGETIAYGVADPSIFSEDGGPSHGERMARAGLRWRRADNTRVGKMGALSGWDQVRTRILGDVDLNKDGVIVRDGGPMLVVFDTCRDFIRTVPVLQHDPDRPEDLDTSAEDHAADECFVGETEIATPSGPVALLDLPSTGWLTGPDGNPARYENPRRIDSKSPLIRVKFEDGESIDCTADHNFLTENGWCEAKDLGGLSVLMPSRSSARLCKSLKASASISAVAISSARASGCTSQSGEGSTVKSLPAITSTMTMKTGRTTSLGTYCSRLVTRISPTTCLSGLTKVARSWLGLLGPPPLSGTEATLGEIGTGDISKRTSDLSSPHGPNTPVTNAAASSKHQRTWRRLFGSATLTAKRKLCVAVEPLRERRPVWCLTVPEWGAFVLANGAVVQNCRYGCLSRPMTAKNPVRPNNPPDLGYGQRKPVGDNNWKTL